MRPFQRRARSSASRATTISVAPSARQIASQSAKLEATSTAGPSSSTRRSAPQSGYGAFAKSRAASMVSRSIISIAAGVMPAAMIAETAPPASSGPGKPATSVSTRSAIGSTPSVTSVTIPRVPSEPTTTPRRS